MSSIPLSEAAIESFMGSGSFRHCDAVTDLTLEYVENDGRVTALVRAKIRAMSTQADTYDITIYIRHCVSEILRAFCTCPVARKCKHINKVLKRIQQFGQNPIPGPNPAVRARHQAKAQRRAEMLEHASVYIVYICKSDEDSGSDYRRSMHNKERYDQRTLGICFSRETANKCAKKYVEGTYGEEDDSDDDEVDDGGMFVWEDENNEGREFSKVWVDHQPIEDASPQFRM